MGALTLPGRPGDVIQYKTITSERVCYYERARCRDRGGLFVKRHYGCTGPPNWISCLAQNVPFTFFMGMTSEAVTGETPQ